MQKLVKLNGKLPIMIMKNTLLLTSLNKKINSNKTKHLIIENELKNFKSLIQVIFVLKKILVMMVLKVI